MSATLTTPRLLLRLFAESDLENVYRGLSHPDVIKYYGVHFENREDTKKQLQWFAELETDGTGRWWAICSRDNKLFYGAVGLYYIKKDLRKAEIGFWVLPEYWNQGFISEAIPPVLQYGMETMHLQKIEAEVETENHASKKIMQKMGFVLEETLSDCEEKNGQLISLEKYCFTKM